MFCNFCHEIRSEVEYIIDRVENQDHSTCCSLGTRMCSICMKKYSNREVAQRIVNELHVKDYHIPIEII